MAKIEKAPQKEELSVERSFQMLDQIIEKLEDEDVTLDESFRLYKEGMELIEGCTRSIDMVEKQVLALNDEGELREF